MAQNYVELEKTVLELVGGEENVTHFEHCSTCLRFTIADPSKVDREKLKETPGVMGVAGSGNHARWWSGTMWLEAYDKIMKIAHFDSGKKATADVPADTKGNLGAAVLDFMVGVFQPLVRAIARGSILKVFMSLFSVTGLMDSGSILYQVLMLVADAPLYFLPVLVAITMATKLDCNRLVAAATVGALLLPKTTALLTAETAPVLFGLTIQNVTYAYQVFPAILAVGLISLKNT